jgi:hypothetical protein
MPTCWDSLSEKDFGVIVFVRKCEFVLYSKQILDAGCWILDRQKKKSLVLTSIQEPASSICSSLLGQKYYHRI